MRKWNIFGWLKKWNEFLKRLWPQKLYSKKSSLGRTLDVDRITDFFGKFMGVYIVGFESYSDKVEDYEDELIGKMIIGITPTKDSIILKLASINSYSTSYLRIKPSVDGVFTGTFDESSNPYTSFRIEFYGGSSIEYSDITDNDSLYFTENIEEL